MLAVMPARILVVKRPRGGWFAALRGVPTSLRAILASGRAGGAAPAESGAVGAGTPFASAARGRGDASAALAPRVGVDVDVEASLERLRTGLAERAARLVEDDARGRATSSASGASPSSTWDGATLPGPAHDGASRVELGEANASSTLRWLREDPALGFDTLFDLTIVDRSPAWPRFEVVYSLRSSATGRSLRVGRPVGADPPEVDSVVPLWRSADWLEREAWDLFGVRFRGHPGLERILLPPDFDGAPLLRDGAGPTSASTDRADPVGPTGQAAPREERPS